MQGRTGATLVEVLVAIFVMGLGLLAILALFPLGALQMAQSLRDNRTAQAVKNARGIAAAHDWAQDKNLHTLFDFFGPQNSSGPSYPVLLDPIGYITDLANKNPNPAPYSLCQGHLPRTFPTNFTLNMANCYKWFSILDDIYFDKDNKVGEPLGSPNFDRDIRYSWAFVMQRPNSSLKNIVNINVLVFESRSLMLNTGLNLPERKLKATVNPNNQYIYNNVIPAIPPIPSLKIGDWIMDATILQPQNTPLLCSFARIVGLTDYGSSYDIEVDQPIPYYNFYTTRDLIFFENVVGVY